MKRLSAMIRLLFSGACAALLAGCQTSTPMSRAGKNPVMFSMLSPEHQALVQQGRICRGMSKDAVFLAWGNPNSTPVTGQQNGAPYEKWVYMTYRPVMMNTVSFGGGCWHHGGWHAGGLGTSTAYVPQESAWVVFENDKVVSWESRN